MWIRCAEAKAIVAELKKYDPELHAKPRWLVLNKIDMIPSEEREARVKDFVKRFKLEGAGAFSISGLTREGCEPLLRAIYEYVAVQKAPPHAGARTRASTTALKHEERHCSWR